MLTDAAHHDEREHGEELLGHRARVRARVREDHGEDRELDRVEVARERACTQ
jgi:hypothetical protein